MLMNSNNRGDNKMPSAHKLGDQPTRYNTLKDARAAALKMSQENPKVYVTLFAMFSLIIHTSKSLNVFQPSDSPQNCKSYWLSGKEKSFSQKQVIAD